MAQIIRLRIQSEYLKNPLTAQYSLLISSQRKASSRLKIESFGHHIPSMTLNRQWSLGAKLALLGALWCRYDGFLSEAVVQGAAD